MKRPFNRENHGNNRTSLIYTVVTLKYIVEFILKYLTNLQRYTPESRETFDRAARLLKT